MQPQNPLALTQKRKRRAKRKNMPKKRGREESRRFMLQFSDRVVAFYKQLALLLVILFVSVYKSYHDFELLRLQIKNTPSHVCAT